jgi:hypothetical protein
MKAVTLLLAVFLLAAPPAHSASLSLRVVRFEEHLPVGGKLRCLFSSNDQFGFLLSRPTPGGYQVDGISNGTVEGEATRRMAVRKDSDSPLVLYLSSYVRADNYGSYLEFLIDKRFDSRSATYPASVMYTEAFYESGPEGEKESLHPIFKKALRCLPE